MYSYIRDYITHFHPNRNVRNLYILHKQLWDDGSVIRFNGILLALIHELYIDHLLQPSDDDSSDAEADGDNACDDPEQPPVQTSIYGTPHFDNDLASKPIITMSFVIFDDEREE